MYQPTEEDEREWQKSRIGYFSASELHLLVSRSGKFTETNLNYLYKIQRQRFLNQPAPPVHSWTMQQGIENESYAAQWFIENTDKQILHFGHDCPKMFRKCDNMKFGASPDCQVICENALVEIKCVVGDKETNWYFSPSVPYEQKKKEAFIEHCNQLIGQFIVFGEIETIYLLKYDFQSDEDFWDNRSPLDNTRGIIFKFERNYCSQLFNPIIERIDFSDKYIDSGKNIDEIQNEWVLWQKKKTLLV